MIPPDVLQSNRDLTAGERHHFKQLAHDTNAKLKAVREALATLKQEEEGLLKTSENYRQALAPIRKLPRDVIGEIFLTCVRGQEPSMSCTKAPVLLTHICSGFRDIALSMPTLWATISLDIPDTSYTNKDRKQEIKLCLQWRVDAIAKWIERSGNMPLSIKLTALNLLGSWETDQRTLAEALLKSAARWCHLSLDIQQSNLIAIQILGLTPDQVPLLTTLRTFYAERLLPCDISQARKLTELSLHGSSYPFQYDVNWAQLTRLTLWLYCLDSETKVKILRTTQNLAYLSFFDGALDNTIDEIYLPHLRELEVHIKLALKSDDLSVSSSIHAPVLKTLCARYHSGVAFPTNLVKRSPYLCNLEIDADRLEGVVA